MSSPLTASRVEVLPVAPKLGAEIRGLDLTTELSEEDFMLARDALLQHEVVFFTGQGAPMTPEQQIAFGRRFGELHQHPAAPHLDGYPEIFVIHTHKDSKVSAGEGWHTDVSCDEEPPSATMLQLQLLPPVGGDTLWSSTTAAYEALSEPMKAFVGGLTALHSSEHIYRGRYKDRGVDDSGHTFPQAVHPVVRVHPETGRRAIFVNRAFTTRIMELGPGESRAVLDMLFDHVEAPRFQVRWRWGLNDVAFWDNRSTQHIAMWDYHPNERKGHRVTIAGDRPVGPA